MKTSEDILKAIVAKHQCDCETCAHTAAICPATATSYVMEIAGLQRQLTKQDAEIERLKDQGCEFCDMTVGENRVQADGYPPTWWACGKCYARLQAELAEAERLLDAVQCYCEMEGCRNCEERIAFIAKCLERKRKER